jgi:hypothetical protein
MAERIRNDHGRYWERAWHWQDCQEDFPAVWRREAPSEPAQGQGWLDARTKCLYIWDGTRWVCVPSD